MIQDDDDGDDDSWCEREVIPKEKKKRLSSMHLNRFILCMQEWRYTLWNWSEYNILSLEKLILFE
jgi:hypothetical protein